MQCQLACTCSGVHCIDRNLLSSMHCLFINQTDPNMLGTSRALSRAPLYFSSLPTPHFLASASIFQQIYTRRLLQICSCSLPLHPTVGSAMLWRLWTVNSQCQIVNFNASISHTHCASRCLDNSAARQLDASARPLSHGFSVWRRTMQGVMNGMW